MYGLAQSHVGLDEYLDNLVYDEQDYDEYYRQPPVGQYLSEFIHFSVCVRF